MSTHPRAAPLRRWPLALIGAPAAVAIWSGWVGLGGLCGFGPIRPLPGIASAFTLNTAITLPVGVEAYGAYALGAWLTPGTPERAQDFARRSAIGALALGMCGQIIYHLLAAARVTAAPWPVTALVACIPVATLGMAAALTHMLRAEPAPGSTAVTPETGDPAVTPQAVPGSAAPAIEKAPQVALDAAPEVTSGDSRDRPRERAEAVPGKQPGPVTPARLAEHYAADLAAGQVPSARRIKREWPVGYDRATALRGHLERQAAGAAS